MNHKKELLRGLWVSPKQYLGPFGKHPAARYLFPAVQAQALHGLSSSWDHGT